MGSHRNLGANVIGNLPVKSHFILAITLFGLLNAGLSLHMSGVNLEKFCAGFVG
jgi:hypothetical protein